MSGSVNKCSGSLLPIYTGKRDEWFYFTVEDQSVTVSKKSHDNLIGHVRDFQGAGGAFDETCKKVVKLINNRLSIPLEELQNCKAYKSLMQKQEFYTVRDKLRKALELKEQKLSHSRIISTLSNLGPGKYRAKKVRVNQKLSRTDRRSDEGLQDKFNEALKSVPTEDCMEYALAPSFNVPKERRDTSDRVTKLWEREQGSFSYQVKHGKVKSKELFVHWRQPDDYADWCVNPSEAKQAGRLNGCRYIEQEGTTKRISLGGRMNTMDRVATQFDFMVEELDDFVENHSDEPFKKLMQGKRNCYKAWLDSAEYHADWKAALTQILSNKLPQGIAFNVDKDGVMQFDSEGRPKLKLRMIDHSMMSVYAISANDASDEPKRGKLGKWLWFAFRLVVPWLSYILSWFKPSLGPISPDYQLVKVLWSKKNAKSLLVIPVILGRLFVIGFFVEWFYYGFHKEKAWSQAERVLCECMDKITEDGAYKIGNYECGTETHFAHLPFNHAARKDGFQGDQLTDRVERYLSQEIQKQKDILNEKKKMDQARLSPSQKSLLNKEVEALSKKVIKLDQLYTVGFKPKAAALPEEQLLARIILAEELNIRLYLHCKSGKDRTGLASMVAIAWLNYGDIHGDQGIQDWSAFCNKVVTSDLFKGLTTHAGQVAVKSAEVLAGKGALCSVGKIDKRLTGNTVTALSVMNSHKQVS